MNNSVYCESGPGDPHKKTQYPKIDPGEEMQPCKEDIHVYVKCEMHRKRHIKLWGPCNFIKFNPSQGLLDGVYARLFICY